MKKIVSLLVLFCLTAIITDAHVTRVACRYEMVTPKTTFVYICISSSSYAYHKDKYCRGLQRCTHEISYVSLEDAQNKYYRKPCKICY
jgi:hypothetical protein